MEARHMSLLEGCCSSRPNLSRVGCEVLQFPRGSTRLSPIANRYAMGGWPPLDARIPLNSEKLARSAANNPRAAPALRLAGVERLTLVTNPFFLTRAAFLLAAVSV